MKAIATRGDDYLIYKFGKLQEAASFAHEEISAIPGEAFVSDVGRTILSMFGKVDRPALAISLLAPETDYGARLKERTVAWLNRRCNLVDLLVPIPSAEIAA